MFLHLQCTLHTYYRVILLSLQIFIICGSTLVIFVLGLVALGNPDKVIFYIQIYSIIEIDFEIIIDNRYPLQGGYTH